MQLLNIAYLSYEFPPHTAVGGIATYTENIAQLMAARGHHIEVFTSGPFVSLNEPVATNLTIHRIPVADRQQFHQVIVDHFIQREEEIKFDLVESPEYQKVGFSIQQRFPELPMIIRFHTPSFWVKALNKTYQQRSFKEQLKKTFGIKQYKKETDAEYLFAQQANHWSVPSQVMKEVLIEHWNADSNRITVLPNPFHPTRTLLNIPADTNSNTITYIGRLEIRKGLIELTKAIPLVLQQYPTATFRFIGPSDRGPGNHKLMVDYMQQELKAYTSQLEFIPPVPKNELETYFAQTDICVFPSLWEVFGYVCVEAMAAARGIVAGNIGGMKEMLQDIDGGILVNPTQPEEIANAILQLLRHPQQRMEMGLRSRQKTIDYYSNHLITETEEYYRSLL